jgi:hypothetical protein
MTAASDTFKGIVPPPPIRPPSRATIFGCKEDDATRKQTNERFHALNLRLESKPRIRFDGWYILAAKQLIV